MKSVSPGRAVRARCRVLGRANSTAIGAPCVLASHPPSAPRSTSVILRRAPGSGGAPALALAPSDQRVRQRSKYEQDDGAAERDRHDLRRAVQSVLVRCRCCRRRLVQLGILRGRLIRQAVDMVPQLVSAEADRAEEQHDQDEVCDSTHDWTVALARYGAAPW